MPCTGYETQAPSITEECRAHGLRGPEPRPAYNRRSPLFPNLRAMTMRNLLDRLDPMGDTRRMIDSDDPGVITCKADRMGLSYGEYQEPHRTDWWLALKVILFFAALLAAIGIVGE